MRSVRTRFVWPALAVSFCLVMLCAVAAISLFHQQSTIAATLRENVASRRAAADLRSTLNTLVALERHQVESVADLHGRAQTQLVEIQQLADHAIERDLSNRLNDGFAEYLRRWHSLPPLTDPDRQASIAAVTRFLEEYVLYPCREYEGFNDRRIEETIGQHERVLRQLAWGIAAVTFLGIVAGSVLGYGIARWLSRSIRRLQIQVRDAAGKLSPHPPEIVLTEEGDFHELQTQIDQLTTLIEDVVQTLQQREREVLRAEQLAAVGQLAAGVGHEIRNPLTSIKMLVQAALEDNSVLFADDLQVIEGEIRRVERLLQTFLDLSRPSKAERRPTDLNQLVQQVAGLMHGRAERQRITVEVDLPPDGLNVCVDAEQCRQVLVNVCLNAIDAMPTGGLLRLAARASDSGVRIEVSDTGCGVPEPLLPRLFEPFLSSKDTGLGLGLMISKRIVEAHGGTITVSNRRERGARVVITLPVS